MKREENTWVPIEDSGKFSFGVLTKKGYRLVIGPGHVVMDGSETVKRIDPKTEKLTSTEDEETRAKHFRQGEREENGVLLDQTSPFLSITRPLVSWLHGKGFLWLGIDSPAIRRPGRLIINRVTLTGDRAKLKGRPLSEWVSSKPKEVRGLRIHFPIYILVGNIDLADANKAEALVRVDILVKQPYKLWYGLGSKAFEAIETKVATHVRNAFEEFSLEQLLFQTDQEKAGVFVDDPKARLRSNAQDLIEQKIKVLIESPETEYLGVQFLGIEIEDWDYTAPTGFVEALQKKFLEQAKRASALEVEKTRQQIAEARVKSEQGELAEATARTVTNTERFNALRALAGGDKAIERVLENLISQQGLGENFVPVEFARALRETGISQLMLAGASTDAIVGMLATNKPQPPTK